MGLQTTSSVLDFQAPNGLSPQTVIVTGGLPPYSASSSDTSIATVAQGTSPNLMASADTLSGWTLNSFTQFGTDGPNGAKTVEIAGTSAAFSNQYCYSPTLTVVPGTTYVFSMWVNASVISSGHATLFVDSPALTTAYITVNIGPGSDGRVITPAWTCPVGVTQVKVAPDAINAVVASGQYLKFSQPMQTVQGYSHSVYISPTSAFTVTPKYRGSATITYTDSTP